MGFRSGVTNLWLVRWGHSELSVLLASSREEAGRFALQRARERKDGWPTPTDSEPRDLYPVHSLELAVAPHAETNRPRFGSLIAGSMHLDWSGPHSIYGERNRCACVFRSDEPLRSDAAPQLAVWSFVWSPRELVLFSARDREAAMDWAGESDYGGRGVLPPRSVEPVEDFELQLRWDRTGYAPTCYRVRIECLEVGWPPTLDQADWSPGSPPTGPLPAMVGIVRGIDSDSEDPEDPTWICRRAAEDG